MQCSSSHSVRILALLAAAVFITSTMSACLGGDPKETPDAAVAPPDAPPGEQPDAGDDAPDAQPGDIDAGVEPPPPQACVDKMADAPSGVAASFADSLATTTVNVWGKTDLPGVDDPTYPGGKYRTLTPDANGDVHPGCSTVGLTYTPANIQDYPCAAKQYPFPTDVSEDTSKPIIILIHGNSDSPAEWEGFLHPNPASITGFTADTEEREQLAELLPAAGYRTIAVDFRTDLVLTDDPGGTTGNFVSNFDHGWAVPMAEALIKQVIIANPGRRVSLIGFSLGATVVRDALRRLFVQFQNDQWDVNVFTRVDDVIVASGGHHGVDTYDDLCGVNTTMRGTAACEFGQRNTYTQVPFHVPLNGPALTGASEAFGGWYETPCADASYAFGVRDACGGHAVEYSTFTMKDEPGGTQLDEFVSEHASRLYPVECANNVLTTSDDFDTSGYFFNGFLRFHFGSVRSAAGLTLIVAALAD
jgi:pimeloyl-ACP methyl ester carboxylesterase